MDFSALQYKPHPFPLQTTDYTLIRINSDYSCIAKIIIRTDIAIIYSCHPRVTVYVAWWI